VIRACFPAGTVSGAPKIRAMEIIDELEPRGAAVCGRVAISGSPGNGHLHHHPHARDQGNKAYIQREVAWWRTASQA